MLNQIVFVLVGCGNVYAKEYKKRSNNSNEREQKLSNAFFSKDWINEIIK